MTVKTITNAMTKQEAEDTAKQLGPQYSAYGVSRKDSNGYTTDEDDWFVEFDDSIMPDRIFGYPIHELLAKQYKQG